MEPKGKVESHTSSLDFVMTSDDFLSRVPILSAAGEEDSPTGHTQSSQRRSSTLR